MLTGRRDPNRPTFSTVLRLSMVRGYLLPAEHAAWARHSRTFSAPTTRRSVGSVASIHPAVLLTGGTGWRYSTAAVQPKDGKREYWVSAGRAR